MNERCDNCRFWKPRGGAVGQCTSPLPVSLSGWLVRLKLTANQDGTDCKAFRKRIVRQKKAQPAAA